MIKTQIMPETQPRQNFHEESEAGINKQINMELYASYVYQSMVRKFTHLSIKVHVCHVFYTPAKRMVWKVSYEQSP